MKKIKKNLNVIIKVIITIFYNMLTLVRNKKTAKQLLLYTDSRGTEINSYVKQNNPFYSYLKLFDDYKADYQFCKHKFTSILDFIEYLEKTKLDYDLLILQCGIVDFAPRPLSSYNEMLSMKSDFLDEKGWLHYFEKRTDFLCEYEEEKTLQFMSLDFLENEIIPILSKIENLIYVGINPVLNDWDGNYWRKRPTCINKQLHHDNALKGNVKFSIDLSNWSEVDIKKYSVDNVHYNMLGLEYIGKKILSVVNSNEQFRSKQ